MRLDLHATPEEVMRAVEALQTFGRKICLGEREIFGLALALEECASNIYKHACGRDARQTFQVSFEHTGNALTIELRDHGPEFDPTLVRAETATDEDSRSPGGWGIPLVRRYIDEIHYRREADQNVLRLTTKVGRTISHPDSKEQTK